MSEALEFLFCIAGMAAPVVIAFGLIAAGQSKIMTSEGYLK